VNFFVEKFLRLNFIVDEFGFFAKHAGLKNISKAIFA